MALEQALSTLDLNIPLAVVIEVGNEVMCKGLIDYTGKALPDGKWVAVKVGTIYLTMELEGWGQAKIGKDFFESKCQRTLM